jgi:hypothetical protein
LVLDDSPDDSDALPALERRLELFRIRFDKRRWQRWERLPRLSTPGCCTSLPCARELRMSYPALLKLIWISQR